MGQDEQKSLDGIVSPQQHKNHEKNTKYWQQTLWSSELQGFRNLSIIIIIIIIIGGAVLFKSLGIY
jgi:hypothetical protein